MVSDDATARARTAAPAETAATLDEPATTPPRDPKVPRPRDSDDP
jgi:hypothetical protein